MRRALLLMQLLTGAVVFDGNSLTKGFGATVSYPEVVVAALGTPPALVATNLSVNGQTTIDMIARAPLVDACYSGDPDDTVFAWEMTNHIVAGATGPEAADAFMSYCRSRRAAGWRVIALTGTPRTRPTPEEYAQFEIDRQIANAMLRASQPTFSDALVDVGGDSSVIGYAGAEDDTTYYTAGKLHLNDTGYRVVARAVFPALIPDAAAYAYEDNSR